MPPTAGCSRAHHPMPGGAVGGCTGGAAEGLAAVCAALPQALSSYLRTDKASGTKSSTAPLNGVR